MGRLHMCDCVHTVMIQDPKYFQSTNTREKLSNVENQTRQTLYSKPYFMIILVNNREKQIICGVIILRLETTIKNVVAFII